MKKLLVLLLVALAVVACKKPGEDPKDPVTDAREQFVGEWVLTISGELNLECDNSTIGGLIPESVPIDMDFDMTIEKDPDDAAQVLIKSDIYNCKALVSGNHLVLESSTESKTISASDFVDADMLDGLSVPVTYSMVHKTASLDNGVLAWHTDATGSASVSIAIISANFTGNASIENSAERKTAE